MVNKIIIGILLCFVLFISGCATQDYTIEGDSVLVDNDLVYIKTTPHTLQGNEWVETEFASKQYSGDIDFAFGFDTETVRPKKLQIYNQTTTTIEKSFTCNEEYDYIYTLDPNYLTCYETIVINRINNQTGLPENYNYNNTIWAGFFDRDNLQERTVYWNVTSTIDWHNWNPINHIEFEYDGMSDWWYATNKHVEAGETYKIRYYLETPWDSQGKYALALKPSSETFEEAVANENFYYLDPWWDSSWLYKRIISINNTEAIDLNNETIVLANITLFDSGNNFSDLRVVENNQEIAYELFDTSGGGENYYNLTSSLTDRAKFYYSLDNANRTGTTVIDLAGNINATELNTPTTGQPGIQQESYTFDGVNEFLSTTTQTWGHPTNITVTMWIKTASTSSSFLFSLGNDDSEEFALEMGGAGSIQILQHKASGNYWQISSGRNDNDGDWHFIVASLNGTGTDNIHLWIDNIYSVTSPSTVGSPSAISDTSNRQVKIARRIGNTYFNGIIDEIGLWAGQLNSTQRELLYAETNPQKLRFVTDIAADSTKEIEIYYGNSEVTEPDYSDCGTWAPCTPLWDYSGLIGWWSGDENVLDYSGSTNGRWVSTETYTNAHNGLGMDLDGSDNYIGIWDNSVFDDIQSLSVWVNSSAITANMWLASQSHDGAGEGFRLRTETSSSTTLQASLFTDVTGVCNIDYSGYGNRDGIMTNIVLNHNKSENLFKLYVDGSFIDSTACSGDLVSSTDPVRIGEFGTTSVGSSFDGVLDEFKLWKIPITAFPQENLIITIENEEINGLTVDPTIAPQTVYSTTELNCSLTYLDDELGHNGNIDFTWYKNGANVNTYDTQFNNQVNGTYLTSDQVIESLTPGDIWICQAYAEDASNSTRNTTQNSTSITVLNTAPTFDHDPINYSDYHSINISLDINCSDLDTTDLNYSIRNLTTDLNSNLTINITTGIIEHDPILNDTGFHQYNVSCTDGTAIASQLLNITLLNRAPTIPTDISPIDNWTIFTDNVNLSCNGSTDADNDDIYYEFWGNKTGETHVILQNTTSIIYNWTGLTLGETYNWNCRVHDTLNYSDFIANRTIELINFTNCAGSGDNVVLNFTYQNEDNATALSETFKANFQLESDDGDISEALFDLGANTNHAICLDNNNQSITINSGMIEYVTDSFDARNYYFWDAVINQNETNNIILYSLPQTLASGISITVSDESGSGLEEHLIYVERYNVETDTYNLIAMGKTGDDGKDTIFLRGGTTSTGDVWYRFKVYYQGELLFTGLPQKIIAATLSLKVGLTDYIDHVENINDVGHTLTYNDETNVFTSTFSTTSGLSRNFCMKVVEERPGKYFYDKYEQCLSSASGALTYTHDNTSWAYHAYTYGYASAKDAYDSIHVENLTNNLGDTGIFITALLIIILVTIGTFSPVASVLLGTLGIIAAKEFGLLTVAQSTIAAIVTLALIIIIKVGRSGR